MIEEMTTCPDCAAKRLPSRYGTSVCKRCSGAGQVPLADVVEEALLRPDAPSGETLQQAVLRDMQNGFDQAIENLILYGDAKIGPFTITKKSPV